MGRVLVGFGAFLLGVILGCLALSMTGILIYLAAVYVDREYYGAAVMVGAAAVTVLALGFIGARRFVGAKQGGGDRDMGRDERRP